MTALELKAEILKAIDSVPEKRLPEVLEHINQIKHTSPSKEEMEKFIDRVFQEDDGLLRRLAE